MGARIHLVRCLSLVAPLSELVIGAPRRRRRRAWRRSPASCPMRPARRARPDRHRDQPGHQHRLHRRDERRPGTTSSRACRLARTSSRRSCRASRASSRRSRCRPRRRPAWTSSWRSATSRRRLDVIATGAVLQTENAVVGTKVEREQIEKLPAQARNLSTVTLFTAGHDAAEPVVVQQPERRRPALRQRPAAAGEQLHASTASTRTRRSTTASRISRAPTPWNRSASRRTTTRRSSAT